MKEEIDWEGSKDKVDLDKLKGYRHLAKKAKENGIAVAENSDTNIIRKTITTLQENVVNKLTELPRKIGEALQELERLKGKHADEMRDYRSEARKEAKKQGLKGKAKKDFEETYSNTRFDLEHDVKSKLVTDSAAEDLDPNSPLAKARRDFDANNLEKAAKKAEAEKKKNDEISILNARIEEIQASIPKTEKDYITEIEQSDLFKNAVVYKRNGKIDKSKTAAKQDQLRSQYVNARNTLSEGKELKGVDSKLADLAKGAFDKDAVEKAKKEEEIKQLQSRIAESSEENVEETKKSSQERRLDSKKLLSYVAMGFLLLKGSTKTITTVIQGIFSGIKVILKLAKAAFKVLTFPLKVLNRLTMGAAGKLLTSGALVTLLYTYLASKVKKAYGAVKDTVKDIRKGINTAKSIGSGVVGAISGVKNGSGVLGKISGGIKGFSKNFNASKIIGNTKIAGADSLVIDETRMNDPEYQAAVIIAKEKLRKAGIISDMEAQAVESRLAAEDANSKQMMDMDLKQKIDDIKQNAKASIELIEQTKLYQKAKNMKDKAIDGVKRVIETVGSGIKGIGTAVQAIPFAGKVAAAAIGVAGLATMLALVKKKIKAANSDKNESSSDDSSSILSSFRKFGKTKEQKALEKQQKKLEKQQKKEDKLQKNKEKIKSILESPEFPKLSKVKQLVIKGLGKKYGITVDNSTVANNNNNLNPMEKIRAVTTGQIPAKISTTLKENFLSNLSKPKIGQEKDGLIWNGSKWISKGEISVGQKFGSMIWNGERLIAAKKDKLDDERRTWNERVLSTGLLGETMDSNSSSSGGFLQKVKNFGSYIAEKLGLKKDENGSVISVTEAKQMEETNPTDSSISYNNNSTINTNQYNNSSATSTVIKDIPVNINQTNSGSSDTKKVQNSLVDRMSSISGSIDYGLGAVQDPDKGTASCASTVGWAYRKVLGVDGMSASSTAQSKDSRFETIWVNDGSPLKTSILQPGDVLYQNWNQTKNNGDMDHTEMYAGNNKDWSHGGNPKQGPVLKDLNDYRLKHTMMVRRYKGFVDGNTETNVSTLKDNDSDVIKNNILNNSASNTTTAPSATATSTGYANTTADIASAVTDSSARIPTSNNYSEVLTKLTTISTILSNIASYDQTTANTIQELLENSKTTNNSSTVNNTNSYENNHQNNNTVITDGGSNGLFTSSTNKGLFNSRYGNSSSNLYYKFLKPTTVEIAKGQ